MIDFNDLTHCIRTENGCMEWVNGTCECTCETCAFLRTTTNLRRAFLGVSVIEQPGSHPIGAPGSLMRRAWEIGRNSERLEAFVRWIAQHPDVGDSLTAEAREKQFQTRAREVLAAIIASDEHSAA